MQTRMSVREREFIDQIDEVVRVIASLQPSNPADIAAKFRNLDLATKAATLVSRGIVSWRTGAPEIAKLHFDEAMAILDAG